MRDTRPGRRQASRQTRAIAVSTLGHLLVLGAVVWTLPAAKDNHRPLPVEAELTPWPRVTPRHAPAPPAATQGRRTSDPPVVANPEAAPSAAAHAPAIDAPPQPTPSVPGPPLALRGALGCSSARFLQLTAAEQTACQSRLAAAIGHGPTFGLDPAKKAYLAASADDDAENEAFLVKKPHNGCRPRAGGGEPEQQSVVIGFSCSISF